MTAITEHAATTDVLAIGNAIVDILATVDDDFLERHTLNKGVMTLIEEEAAHRLYDRMPAGTAMSGGSAANTIAALAALGAKTTYIGKVAKDQLGDVFSHDMKATGVAFDTPPLTEGPATARCLIFVTPDAQRTMCTFLGASTWVMESDVTPEKINAAKVTYLEGYLFDRPHSKRAFKRACDLAHAAGRKVSLTLSDPFCVERHRDEFLELVEKDIDILFANEAEIKALYQEQDINICIAKLRETCEIGAVTRGASGSLIVAGDETAEIPAIVHAPVVDTTGAGDMYAAGFLYGYTHGLSLRDSGMIASRLAGEIITRIGARMQAGDIKAVLSDARKTA